MVSGGLSRTRRSVSPANRGHSVIQGPQTGRCCHDQHKLSLDRKYLPTLTSLAQNYFDEKDVQFIAVNCIATDKPEDMRKLQQQVQHHRLRSRLE